MIDDCNKESYWTAIWTRHFSIFCADKLLAALERRQKSLLACTNANKRPEFITRQPVCRVTSALNGRTLQLKATMQWHRNDWPGECVNNLIGKKERLTSAGGEWQPQVNRALSPSLVAVRRRIHSHNAISSSGVGQGELITAVTFCIIQPTLHY